MEGLGLSDPRRYVVIGGGQAGARAAAAMRAAGFAGSVVIVGTEPHLPYERPMLSKALLLDPATQIPFVFADSSYMEREIELRLGCTASEIDRKARTVAFDDGTSIGYDKLLLATGGRLRRVAIPGIAPEAINYLRNLDECRILEAKLKEATSVAIIGGGFIGLEVAASAAKLGCSVTVVEAADRLLPRLGSPEASASVLGYHRSAGMDVRLNSNVSHGDGTTLHLGDGSTICARVIVAGIGVSPETSLAERAGLAVQNGIIVDEYGQTSDERIFAAGDATYHYHPLLNRHIRLESWQNANMQAEAAGRAMAGLFVPYQEIPWLWSDQGDLNLQMAGAPVNVDQTVMRGKPDDASGMTIFQLADSRLVGGITVNRGKDMTLVRRLLAQGSLALPATDLADEMIPLRNFLPARTAA